jgi:hypothetical protein
MYNFTIESIDANSIKLLINNQYSLIYDSCGIKWSLDLKGRDTGGRDSTTRSDFSVFHSDFSDFSAIFQGGKGGVTRATKLLQLATKSDFDAC